MINVSRGLEEFLPPIIWRERWNHFAASCGLPYKASYLANLNCIGKGPKPHKMGRKVYYDRSEVLAWLNEQMTSGGAR